MSTIDTNPPLPVGSAVAPGRPTPATHRSLSWKLIHSTNGLMAHFAGTRVFPLWGIIEHRGRKSGRAFATPVVTRRVADGFLIPMPFGPETDWTRNVLAAGGSSIRWKGRRYELTSPEIIDAESAESAFSGFERAAFGPIGIHHFLRLHDAH